MKTIILTALVLLFCIHSLAFAWDATVDKVHDGDTITVRAQSGGRLVKIRLWGIDCPEYEQASGGRATEFAQKLLAAHQTVSVEDKGRDSYKRRISIVRLPDGRIVQEELLKRPEWHGYTTNTARNVIAGMPWKKNTDRKTRTLGDKTSRAAVGMEKEVEELPILPVVSILFRTFVSPH